MVSPRLVGGAALVAIATAGACSRPPQPDAYGSVEATEVIVSAEATGQLVSFTVEDGQRLAADAVVGTIDVSQLTLERDQLSAQRAATASRAQEVGHQVRALEAQRDAAQAQQEAARAQAASMETQRGIARRAYERGQRLFAQQAATAQQLDQAERDLRVLDDQIKAQAEQIVAQGRQVEAQRAQIAGAQAQRQTVTRQVAAADAQVAQVSDRIRKSDIKNPIAGTVLVTYAKRGEVAQPGQSLYKIANLDTVDVRAYITEPQLSSVRIGQQAQVTMDTGGGRRQVLTGTVSWVSSEAEFTPTPIQTRDERADLVYAVKIRVRNQGGALKIGMPVDVRFVAPVTGATPS
jgi:HlyD family secretion protein